MRMNILLLVVISKILICQLVSCVHDTVVTNSGKISGKTVIFNGKIVKAYLGVPYAKPPVGELRFRKPVPVEPWSATLQAKDLPPGCVQYTSDPFPWKDTPPGLSEDCLYLNIWVPTTSPVTKRKMSVMFWLHIGGFSMSSSRLDFFNGEALATVGDVIVVTINYRLGAEGFFYSGTDEVPGNMGLWDMAEALKWVRGNIESFGGDKDSITLFGNSAGGIAIGMLCVSPVTKGLFKRAIMQSGTPTNLDGEDKDRSYLTSQKLAEKAGCATEGRTLENHPELVLECMRNKDAYELAVLLSEITPSGKRPVYPRYGDEFLPKNPRVAVIDGDFDPVDLIIGTNTGDGSLILTKALEDVFGFFGEKNPHINLTFGASIIRDKFKSYPDPDAVVELYLGGLKEDDYDKIRYQVFMSLADYKRICPSNYFAESFAKKGARVYYYYFTHIPSNTPWARWMLAVHFDETPFVFGYPLRYPHNYTMSEQGFSRRLMLTWSKFAKNGDHLPGTWHQYSRENPFYTILEAGVDEHGYGPHKEECDFFRANFGF